MLYFIELEGMRFYRSGYYYQYVWNGKSFDIERTQTTTSLGN